MKLLVHFIILSISLPCTVLAFEFSEGTEGYLKYHRRIIKAEEFIAHERFEDALDQYERTFDDYGFDFLRDYKVACQVAVINNDNLLATKYMKLGIEHGWSLKEIKKNDLIHSLFKKIPKEEITGLVASYHVKINTPLRKQVYELYRRDQKMAIKALFKIGNKSKVRYNEQKFAPHSEIQISKLISILDSIGYPGERLIGNNYWVSTILSHHNSISTEYNKQDTLFNFIKPKLLEAIKKGQMSPFEFALIENWKIVSISNLDNVSYGFLGPDLDKSTVKTVDNLRKQIEMRSIELRNGLIDIQDKFGINFYLPGHPWQNGKIVINDVN